MNKQNDHECAFFIKLTAYLLNKSNSAVCNDLKNQIVPLWETVDFKKVYSFALFHDMASILSLSAEKLGLTLPKEVQPHAEAAYQKALYKSTLQDMLYEQLSDRFEKEKIRHLPLKGLLIRPLYPYVELRTSGDADVVYHTADAGDRLEEIMGELGFTLTKHSGVVKTFGNTNGIVFEMHAELSDNFEVSNRMRGDFWQVTPSPSSKVYEHRLTDEDFYVYHIAHLAKHFTGKGCGIRPLADIFVFLSRHGDTLNNTVVQEELASIGLVKFEKVMRQIAFGLFAGQELDEFAQECASSILSSGIYGNVKEMAVLDGVKKAKGTGGGLARQIKTFFQPLDYMKVKYPTLYKAPFLLPFFWVYRAANGVIKKRDLYKQIAKSYIELDRKAVEAKVRMFDKLGL